MTTFTELAAPAFFTGSTFSWTPAAVGEILFVEAINGAGSSVYANSVSSSNATWTYTENVLSGTNNVTAALYVGVATSTSAATVTVGWSGTTPGTIRGSYQRVSPSDANWAIDTYGSINQTSGASWASLGPVAAGDMYWGFAWDGNVAVGGSTSGYSYTVDSAHGNGVARNVNCTSGAQQPVWGDTNQQVGVMVLLKQVVTAITSTGAVTFSPAVAGAGAVTIVSTGAPKFQPQTAGMANILLPVTSTGAVSFRPATAGFVRDSNDISAIGAVSFRPAVAANSYPGTPLAQAFQWNGSSWQPYQWASGSIAANTIGTVELAANAVTAAKIAAGTITATQIAASTITAAQIAATTITGALIAANTITGSNIAGGTISADLLVSGITVSGIVDATTINTATLTSAVINGAEINGGVITGAQLVADGASGEILVYSGTPTSGNLVGSWSGMASSDVHGNPYPFGLAGTNITMYGATTPTTPASGSAVMFTDTAGAIQFVTSSGFQGGVARSQGNITSYVNSTTGYSHLCTPWSIPANDAVHAGTCYRLKVYGTCDNGTANQSLGMQVAVFGGTYATQVITIGAASSGRGWRCEATVLIVSAGSGGEAIITLEYFVGGNLPTLINTTATIDTTTATTFQIYGTWNGGSSYDVTGIASTLERW